MNRSELETNADRIETLLYSNQAPATCRGGTLTTRWVQFLFDLQPGVSLDRVQSLAPAIAAAMRVSLTHVSQAGSAIRIDVLRRDPQPVKLSNLLHRIPPERIPACTAVLGLADDGAPLLVRIPAENVQHLCVIADRQHAESVLRTIAVSLAACNRPRQVQLCNFPAATPNNLDESPENVYLRRFTREREGIVKPTIVVAAQLDEARELGLETAHAAGIHCVALTHDEHADITGFNCVLRQMKYGFRAEMAGSAIDFEPAEISLAEVPMLLGGEHARNA